MALVVGVRVGAVALLVFIYTVADLLQRCRSPSIRWTWYPAILLIGVLGLIFIVEPLWRLRTLTAVGLVVSSRMHSSSTTMLSAAGYVFALWIVEGFVFSVVALALSWLFGFGVFILSDRLWLICFAPLLDRHRLRGGLGLLSRCRDVGAAPGSADARPTVTERLRSLPRMLQFPLS